MAQIVTPAERLETYLSEHGGFIRLEDLREQGIDRRHLYALRREGIVERIGQGLYGATDVEVREPSDLADVAMAIPHGVICLTSALEYHELTDEIPPFVHVAVEGKRWAQRVVFPPVRTYSFSGQAFSAGIEEIKLDGRRVKIYNKEKTIADCLKYRKKLPPGVAQDALRQYLRQRGVVVDRLLPYARICRVERLLSCYLEVLI